MNGDKVVAWINAATTLLTVGVMTVDQVVTMIRSNQGALTDSELNAVCDLVLADARRRKALAEQDASPNG